MALTQPSATTIGFPISHFAICVRLGMLNMIINVSLAIKLHVRILFVSMDIAKIQDHHASVLIYGAVRTAILAHPLVKNAT